MGKKCSKRSNLKKSNLNPNGTTIDGGFPRHRGWVNPYDWWKVAINKLIEIIAICFPIGFVFSRLLNVGILEPIINVINGSAPFKSHMLLNLFILGIIVLLLVIYPIITIADVVWYIKTGKRSFLLSRPIRKIWNKNLGEYDYKQNEYQDSAPTGQTVSSKAGEHLYDEDKYQMLSRAKNKDMHAMYNNLGRYDSNWQYYNNPKREEHVSSRMLVLLIIEIIFFSWLKELGAL